VNFRFATRSVSYDLGPASSRPITSIVERHKQAAGQASPGSFQEVLTWTRAQSLMDRLLTWQEARGAEQQTTDNLRRSVSDGSAPAVTRTELGVHTDSSASPTPFQEVLTPAKELGPVGKREILAQKYRNIIQKNSPGAGTRMAAQRPEPPDSPVARTTSRLESVRR
jgi:hypothetical protein